MTRSSVSAGGEPLNVLAWPLRSGTNPYTGLLSEALASHGARVRAFSPRAALLAPADVLHMHWPDFQLASASLVRTLVRCLGFFAVLAVLRWRGTKIVWTVHNLASHERRHPRLERVFWRWLAACLDGLVFMGEGTRQEVLQAHPGLAGLPSQIIPHGSYRGVYPDTASRAEARDHLGLPEDADVLVSLGAVRPYKQLPALLRAFRECGGPQTRLLVGGRCEDPALADELAALAADDPRVVLQLRFIKNAEIQYWIRAADLCVLNYREILNSGSALLYLSFERPLMAPSHPVFRELAAFFGDDWVLPCDGSVGARELELGLAWAKRERPPIDAKLDEIAWPSIAAQTISFYRGLADTASRSEAGSSAPAKSC